MKPALTFAMLALVACLAYSPTRACADADSDAAAALAIAQACRRPAHAPAATVASTPPVTTTTPQTCACTSPADCSCGVGCQCAVCNAATKPADGLYHVSGVDGRSVAPAAYTLAELKQLHPGQRLIYNGKVIYEPPVHAAPVAPTYYQTPGPSYSSPYSFMPAPMMGGQACVGSS